MKRTTYILIGLIVSGLIVIIATIIFISTSRKPYPENGLFVGGELVEMNMDGIRVVKMFVSQSEDSKERRIYMNGDVKISSPSTAGERKVVYPKNEYLKVNRMNDTLLMEFDFNDRNIPKKFRKEDYMYATGIDVQMSVDSLNSIFINTQGLKLNLKEVKMDSLFVHAIYQKVLLDSCQFRSFSIDGEELRFKAKDSKIEDFYLNLNSAWDWEIENCDIDTEYLRGSRTHHNTLRAGECKRVVWTPVGKDARLQLYLQEKAEIIVNPE
jgi:hypothetical protein